MIVFGERVCQWVAERTSATRQDGSGQGIGWEKDGQLVAGIVFDNYNGRSAQMHVASDGTRRWMSREFLAIAFDYPFRQLKVNKLIGLVDSTNEAALAFDQAIGFQFEHCVKDAGRKADLVILSMSREQCRWLHLADRYAWSSTQKAPDEPPAPA